MDGTSDRASAKRRRAAYGRMLLVLSGCFVTWFAVGSGSKGERLSAQPPSAAHATKSQFQAPAPTATPAPAERDLFVDRADAAGLDFTHFNGMSGQFYYPEIVGAGAALFDCDNDGDLDVLILQGNMLGPGKTLADAMFRPRQEQPLRARLYRNDLRVGPGGERTLHFTDITERSGLDAHGYGMGVAVGDYNNDGRPDVYVTNFGHNQLFRNNGNCTFSDVTAASGTDDPRWSTSAAFVDYDRDGWLDLFVCNYVDFSFANRKECFSSNGARDYCGPLAYKPVPNRLFRNRGDGTFEDVSARSWIAREYNGALGVVTADFNGDGWPDIFVANDGRPNELWINQQDGTFRNDSLLAGCALDEDGKARAGMGVDAVDFDNDGDEDLAITNLTGEGHMLYVNTGKGWFEERAKSSGLSVLSRPYTGFGTWFLDYDNDGWPDLLTVHGEVRSIDALARAGDPYPLSQRNQLFRNLGDGRFADVTPRAGKVFRLSHVGRGAAFGDIDNDGDTDVVIVNNNGRVQLLINQEGNRRHWLGLRLVDPRRKRDAVGARVAVFRPNAPTLWRRAHADGSYLSANDPRVLIGLGESPAVSKVRVQWPDGLIEEWSGVVADRYIILSEGSGTKTQ